MLKSSPCSRGFIGFSSNDERARLIFGGFGRGMRGMRGSPSYLAGTLADLPFQVKAQSECRAVRRQINALVCLSLSRAGNDLRVGKNRTTLCHFRIQNLSPVEWLVDARNQGSDLLYCFVKESNRMPSVRNHMLPGDSYALLFLFPCKVCAMWLRLGYKAYW